MNTVTSHCVCDSLLCIPAFRGCLPLASLSYNAFVHTQVFCADSSQYRHMTRMLKSQNLAQCVIGSTARWRYCSSQ